MTDPTIPEIVARLRELHAKLQALQVGTPEFTAARQLFRDALQLSAPGILDALDHVGEVNKMARGIPERTQGMQRERSTVVAYLHDRARQWEDDSGIPAILQGLAAEIRSGEHVEARNHGELDDILDALERREAERGNRVAEAIAPPEPGWRPIEECGELEEGAEYLVRMKRGVLEPLITIARWSGAEWRVRIADVVYDYRAEHITHLHEMGPIRGPGEG